MQHNRILIHVHVQMGSKLDAYYSIYFILFSVQWKDEIMKTQDIDNAAIIRKDDGLTECTVKYICTCSR